jgi:hypothetical protein
MNVKLVHYNQNDWRIYPELNHIDDDYYLNSYTLHIDAKMYISTNFYNLIKRECLVLNCKECK